MKKQKKEIDSFDFDIFADTKGKKKGEEEIGDIFGATEARKKQSVPVDIFEDSDMILPSQSIKSPIIQQSLQNGQRKKVGRHVLPSLDIEEKDSKLSKLKSKPSLKSVAEEKDDENWLEMPVTKPTKLANLFNETNSTGFSLAPPSEKRETASSPKIGKMESIPKKSAKDSFEDDEFSSEKEEDVIGVPSIAVPTPKQASSGDLQMNLQMAQKEKLIADLRLQVAESEARAQQHKSNVQQLKSSLQEEKQRSKSLELQISALNKKLEENQKREREETAMLSSMIQQIEENLTAANLRAQNAENSVASLKNKLKKYREMEEVLGVGEEVSGADLVEKMRNQLKEYKGRCHSMKGTASSAAAELNKVTQESAEKVKELVRGIVSLQKAAKYLEVLGKLAEFPDEK